MLRIQSHRPTLAAQQAGDLVTDGLARAANFPAGRH